MKAKILLYNARIYTQADSLVADSMAVQKNRIVAVGNRLESDPDFRSYHRINLKRRTVIPGLVDAHTHFYYFALSLGRVSLDGLPTLEACLEKIRRFAENLPEGDWVVGDGYAPNRFQRHAEPNRFMLDQVTGGRPAFLFSKDQHSAWVNSRALEIAGIDSRTPDPEGATIVRLADRTPTGILREGPAYLQVFSRIEPPSKREIDRRYSRALDHAYRKGVTGVHSFDSPEGFAYLMNRAEQGTVGLRINYYPPARLLPKLHKEKIRYGAGTEFFRIAGVKIFADGSLGSQTALCFDKYIGSKNNCGIEVTSVPAMRKLIASASRLGFPCAVHAIGDRAVSNVLDASTNTPKLPLGVRHRIEHVQLIRRKDISRLKKLNVVASMQPSHCPSDIDIVRRYWGKRAANAYIFRTLIDRNIDLAFGSDAPIEPLDPIAGIAAAVRRAREGSRDTLFPEQRITAAEALARFTVGPAIAAGQQHCRGYLLPGYSADFVVLDQDITKLPPTRLTSTKILATILDGHVMFCDNSLSL